MADKQKVIGFHKPEEPNGYLSNWYTSPFVLDGKHFCCVEQYMMYRKAAAFGDSEIMALILDTEDPGTIQDLGRRVENYDDAVWSACRQVIVYRALLAKFEQNPGLKQKLLDTGEAILAECAHDDKIWGIGLYLSDERHLDLAQWNGLNLLGYALMEVRKQLKENKEEVVAAPSAAASPSPDEEEEPESEEEDRINSVEIIYRRAEVKTQSCEESLVMDRKMGTVTYEQRKGKEISSGQNYHVPGEIASFLDAMHTDLLSRGEEDSPRPIPDPSFSGTCTITITYRSGSAEVLSSSFDQNGLPAWYETFISSMRSLLSEYELGDLFSPVLYRKVYPQAGELIYCSVAFDENEKTYYYQTDDLSMNLGDEVEVPVGPRNTLKTGRIVKTECFTPKEAPFPADQVKTIAGKTIIKKVIGNFKAERTTENLLTVLAVLSDSMVWVPCNARLGEEDQKQMEEIVRQPEKSNVGAAFTNREKIHLVPDILQKGEEYFFPVFSSCQEMGDYGKGFSKVQASFLEAITLARNTTSYEITGIVVNGFSNSLTLGWDLLDIIENHVKQERD